MRTAFLCVVAAAFWLLAPAADCCPGAGPDVVVATVGGEPIRAHDVERLLKEATAGRAIDPAALPLVQAQVLDEIVMRRLVMAYAQRTQSGPSEAEIDAAAGQLAAQGGMLREPSGDAAGLSARVAWRLTWEKYLARYVTEERIASYFAAHRRELDGTTLSVSHILLRAEGDGPAVTDAVVRQAEAIRRAIAAGELSFDEAARRHSAAPSAEDGGRLGFIARHGAMDEAFAAAAFALEADQVSGPVRTRFGVHLIRCDEVRPGRGEAADARSQVVEALARQLLEELARLERGHTAVEFSGKSPYLEPGTGKLVAPR